MPDYRTLLVPHDFSIHAEAALDVAVDLARRLHSDLHLVHVLQRSSYVYAYPSLAGGPIQPPIDMLALRDGITNALLGVAARVESLQPKVQVVEGERVDDALVELAAKLGVDLIVMGTHGRTGLAHVFVGSVAERTLRRAPCPVLTVRAPEPESDR